eukprot:CAMPEP_0175260400 /NCGR_PEP_ID=MMETSP0093-20121207/40229_1 /TAXON_ID=311494 /ORGANISM="Alexandrium monilatum, Strain CCMP3105" /LENGTH=107 /DNA_ID=CAMNT_0016554835 /DNA_START=44 /DNA_END=367 /DNA_ORIENTATION=-
MHSRNPARGVPLLPTRSETVDLSPREDVEADGGTVRDASLLHGRGVLDLGGSERQLLLVLRHVPEVRKLLPHLGARGAVLHIQLSRLACHLLDRDLHLEEAARAACL